MFWPLSIGCNCLGLEVGEFVFLRQGVEQRGKRTSSSTRLVLSCCQDSHLEQQRLTIALAHTGYESPVLGKRQRTLLQVEAKWAFGAQKCSSLEIGDLDLYGAQGMATNPKIIPLRFISFQERASSITFIPRAGRRGGLLPGPKIISFEGFWGLDGTNSSLVRPCWTLF